MKARIKEKRHERALEEFVEGSGALNRLKLVQEKPCSERPPRSKTHVLDTRNEASRSPGA